MKIRFHVAFDGVVSVELSKTFEQLVDTKEDQHVCSMHAALKGDESCRVIFFSSNSSLHNNISTFYAIDLTG